MKLRNKDDGRVREFGIDETKSFPYYLRDEFGNTYWAKTLKEIADKWEEIEEPKEYWCITGRGNLHYLQDMTDENDKDHREIGNVFETKEEAEKAVAKLKALKRLKDKGMRMYSLKKVKTGIDLDFYTLTILAPRDKDFLDLLFGGEE